MTATRKIDLAFLGVGALWLAILGWLVAITPREDGALAMTQSLNPGGWMAWTLPTALFFMIITGLLIAFSYLALRFPERPRMGVLRFETTRGDRLFVTLLGSAFINLAWLGLVGANQPYALILCLLYAAAIFRWA
jgi:predicted small integral membrane protein